MSGKKIKPGPVPKKHLSKTKIDKPDPVPGHLHHVDRQGRLERVGTDDVMRLQKTLGNRAVNQLSVGDGLVTADWHALPRYNAEIIQRNSDRTDTAVERTTSLFARIDPKNDRGVVFNRPVTIEEAKGYLFSHPPSNPSAVLPIPASIISLGHFTRFTLDIEDADVVYGLKPAHLDAHFRPKDLRETEDLAAGLALYDWLTPDVREAVINGTLEEGITYFDGKEPYGIIIAVKDGASLEFWQEFPEDYDFLLEVSGGNETLAKMRYGFYHEFNADMIETIEATGRIEVARARVWKSHRIRAIMMLGAFANAFSAAPLRMGALPVPGRISKPDFGPVGKAATGTSAGTPTRIGTPTRMGPFGGRPKPAIKSPKETTTLVGPPTGRSTAGSTPPAAVEPPSAGVVGSTSRYVPLTKNGVETMYAMSYTELQKATPGFKVHIVFKLGDWKMHWRTLYGGIGAPPKYGYIDKKSKTIVILSPVAR